ncbi:hypothetical protein LPJ64_004366 [Coemansia asiatica]|uniref:DNA 3'-5' helicase n=1 Tax=Coemansia asiatica TaxID=1052880 RepID=A0A9W7XJ27_9FUNG|nr:hypothetical protein LPJ64_004366 [Coemansia asiatica]
MPQLSKRKTARVLNKLKAETQQVSLPASRKKGNKHIALPTASSMKTESKQQGEAKQLRLDDYVVSFTTWTGDTDDFLPNMSTGGGFEKVSKLVGKASKKKQAIKSEEEKKEDTKLVLRLDETQEAITKMDINRPLLIVAGAGSGKTTTLCARVIEMMRQGVAASSILVITFTNKAADELKERIKKYTDALGLGSGDRLPYAATFHSWCYGLVMRNFRVLGWTKCPMVVAAESEHSAIALIAIRQLESCRKLRQCEMMLGIAEAEEEGSGEGNIYVEDADARWENVARIIKEKTGFSIEQQADGEDVAGPSKSRKFGAKANEQAQLRAATDAIYAHLYASIGRARGLTDLEKEPLKLGTVFPGKDMIKSVMAFIYSAKSRGDTPSMYPSSLAGSVLAAYNGTLRKFHLVDFDDLLLHANQVLGHQHILQQVREEYPYLLVDEFQDLNQLQMNLVLLLQKGVGRVTAVGDERQSIFAFRGASCEHNFATFLSSFVDAEVGRVGSSEDKETASVGTMASLTRNYRSHQSIVDLGNIVARETGRGSALLERLRVPLAAQPTAPVVPVAVWSSRDKMAEASRIVKYIARLIKSGDCQPRDIAVISRILNFGSYRPTGLIEQELLRESIPFVVRGGTSALKSPRMQAMMSLVRVVANQTDDVAAEKCLDDVVKDIGPVAKQKIMAFGSNRIRELSLYQRMKDIAQTTVLPKHSRGSLLAFVANVDRWAGIARSGWATLRELVCLIYEEYVQEVEEPEDPRAPVGQKTRPPDAIWEMINAIADSLASAAPQAMFDHDEGDSDQEMAEPGWSASPDAPCSMQTLHLFSSQMCLLSSSAEDKGRVTRAGKDKKTKKKAKKTDRDQEEEEEEEDDEDSNAVVISTVHQAKGLEWEHVFVPHFIDYLFPMGFRGVSEADRVRGGVDQQAVSEHEIQHYREEGRLAYVAITRARRGLYISTLEQYPEFWMKKIFSSECTPSRYLPAIMCPESRSASASAAASQYWEDDSEEDWVSRQYGSGKRGRWY